MGGRVPPRPSWDAVEGVPRSDAVERVPPMDAVEGAVPPAPFPDAVEGRVPPRPGWDGVEAVPPSDAVARLSPTMWPESIPPRPVCRYAPASWRLGAAPPASLASKAHRGKHHILHGKGPISCEGQVGSFVPRQDVQFALIRPKLG